MRESKATWVCRERLRVQDRGWRRQNDRSTPDRHPNRNGQAFHATWHRGALGDPTQFVNAFGVPIPLEPGTTWVELVPSTVGVTATP